MRSSLVIAVAIIMVLALLPFAAVIPDADGNDMLHVALRACTAATAYVSAHVQAVIDEPCSLSAIAYAPWCRTNDGPARIALGYLLNEQTSGLDMLVDSAMASGSLVAQLSDTRMAVGDLIPLVKYSQLEQRAELHVLLEKLADDAKDAARYLQQLSARIGVGSDRITAMLGHTSRLLLDAPPPSMASRPCTLMDFFIPSHDNACVAHPLDPLIIRGAYELALATTEDILRGLVLSGQAALGKLEVLDSRLRAIADVTMNESVVRNGDKEHVLLQLWTSLGGNQKRPQHLQRDAEVLRDVETYRKAAVNHVNMVLDTLENMQSTAEEARRLAAGALLYGQQPDNLVLSVISDGAGRLKSGRAEVVA